jgi:hypothetical protein
MIEMPTTQQKQSRLFITASTLGILSALVWVVTALWWNLEPANLPRIDQPVSILNPNNEIETGTSIIMRLVVDKPVPLNVVGSNRFISCDSGKLQPLVSTERDLPQGSYEIISDSTLLPSDILDGDVCRVGWRVEYEINPIRDEVLEFYSEPFTVINTVLDDLEGEPGPQGPPGEDAPTN